MRPLPPPPAAVRLVARVADPADADVLLGDLAEGFARRVRDDGERAARRWYWKQALILLVGLSASHVKRVLTPGGLALDASRAGRSLARSPGLTLAGIVTLGLGIAAPTATFGTVDAMFSTLPVEDPDRVLSAWLVDPSNGRRVGIPFDLFRTWEDASTGFFALGAFDSHRSPVGGDGLTPRRLEVATMSAGVFRALGVEPLAGRLIAPADDQPGATPVVLLGEALWESWFDRDPDALGTTLRVGEGSYTVIGVMPAGFGFPESHDLWTSFLPSESTDHGISVVGRLAPGATATRAGAELKALVGRRPDADDRLRRAVVRVDEYVLAFHGRRVRTLMGGLNLLVGLLVVIAAANLSAFFLARGTARTGETAVRLALGSGRFGVVRPLVLEALAVSAGGTVLGVALATFATTWMGATLEARDALPYWAEFGLSPGLLAFATALMVGATLVSGLLPALRTSRVDVPHALKAGALRGSGAATGRTLSTLVAVEVTLAFVLLMMSGFVVRSALATVQFTQAFPTEGVLTAELVLDDFAYPTPEDRRLFFQEVERRLAGSSAVAAFSFGSAMPGDGTSDARVVLDGQQPDADRDWPAVQRRVVSPSFFAMFGMPTVEGRTFGPGDPDAPSVAVVNEAYARTLPGGGSVGRSILVGERGQDAVLHEIVGVVEDQGVSVDDGQRVPAIFLPVGTRLPARFRVAVRGGGDGASALPALTEAVHGVDPDLPLDQVMTLEALVRRENDGGRVLGTMFGAVGLGALLLAIVGLYGVVSFTAARRAHDIAVMRALGARHRRVVAWTLRRGMAPVLAGVLVGLVASWFLTPVVGREMLEGTGPGPHDPILFLGVAALLLSAATAAVLVPARRASRIEPAGAMRAE